MKIFIYLLFILAFIVILVFLSALLVRSITFLVISIRKFLQQFTRVGAAAEKKEEEEAAPPPSGGEAAGG